MGKKLFVVLFLTALTGALLLAQDPGSLASRVRRPATCSDGQVLTYNATAGEYECQPGGGGGGAPTDAFYIVKTANITLTNDLVVTPGDALMRRPGETDSNGGPYTLDLNPTETALFYLREEFCSGIATSSGQIGELGWSTQGIASGGTLSVQDGVANHPCLQRVQATNTAGSGRDLALNGFNVWGLNNLSAIAGWEAIWIFKLSSTTDSRFRIGFYNWASTPTAQPANGLWVRYDTSTGFADSNFTFEMRKASTSSTSTLNSIAATSTDWVKIRIRSTTAGTVRFSICAGDGCTLGTETTFCASGCDVNSTNIPTVNLSPGAIVVTDAAANKHIDFDFAAVKIRGLTR